MHAAGTIQADRTIPRPHKHVSSTRPAPYFFAITAGVMLLLVVAGFYPYYLRGEGMRGRQIARPLATLVLVHGGAMTAWLFVFLAATVRMPALTQVFGDGGWAGIFGPVFALGALLVVVRSVLLGNVDRWLVTGYALLVAVYMTACALAVSELWNVWAHALLGV